MSAEPPVAVTPPLATLDDWLVWLEQLHPKKIDFGLDRIVTVLEALSLAQPPFRVVTVGGTNGKGSCVAMLESIYAAAGYRVGAFTSPHLWRFNERVRLAGQDAGDAELVRLLEIIDAARGQVTLSYFETSVVVALLHFARGGADVAVLEVGLGGRLDAVNAVDADGVLIASIDLDHMEWLGEDREAVGWEKAGIMRAGRPAIIGDRDPPARLLAHAADVGARLQVIGRDFDHGPARARNAADVEAGDAADAEDPAAEEGASMQLRAPAHGWQFAAGRHRCALPVPSFGGAVQLGNAAACVALVRALRRVLPVSEQALARGLGSARLRGRLERCEIGGVEWVFDVAHNPAAARTLCASLDTLPKAGRTLAIFAAMRDKDIAGVLAPLAQRVDEWLVTQAEMERGAAPADIVAVLETLGAGPADVAADVDAACRRARARVSAGDRVLVFGSFYMVGPALAAVGLYSAPTES